MLVQVVKEERATRRALTTYLSLAGRYAVIDANTDARAASAARSHPPGPLAPEEVVQDSTFRGHGDHLRTAGAFPHQARDHARLRISDPHVGNRARHDPESQAPTLVYEEARGSSVRCAILYNKEIDEILVPAKPAIRKPAIS